MVESVGTVSVMPERIRGNSVEARETTAHHCSSFPTAGSFGPTGSLAQTRARHTATLLTKSRASRTMERLKGPNNEAARKALPDALSLR